MKGCPMKPKIVIGLLTVAAVVAVTSANPLYIERMTTAFAHNPNVRPMPVDLTDAGAGCAPGSACGATTGAHSGRTVWQ